jgi:hypothetical protein
MIAHADSPVNVRPWRDPLQIATPVVALVAVEMIDLDTIGTAARHEFLSDEGMDADLPNAATIMQFDINITVEIPCPK